MFGMFAGCSIYDQNISSWNVPLIPIKPPLFDQFTPVSWDDDEKPTWGATC